MTLSEFTANGQDGHDVIVGSQGGNPYGGDGNDIVCAEPNESAAYVDDGHDDDPCGAADTFAYVEAPLLDCPCFN